MVNVTPDMPHETAADRLRASPRLFENNFLDKFSRVHWSMPLLVYGPIATAIGVWSLTTMSPALGVGAIVLGYVLWTLTEYLGHRYLFHWEIPGKLGARLHFLIHGVHHVHPSDPLRLVMPPLLSLPIMLIAYTVIRLLFGMPATYPVLTGFIIGYVTYDTLHYYVHHAEPTSRFGRWLQRMHMLHHFRDPERGFGVSAPWLDYLFGTQPALPQRGEQNGQI